ncbi:CHASE2 domain-containing protein [Methylomonas koyamae]|uniref:CHASE2 domain-containing protein n=1 Tax=Methylomonas koyamae TaxID=702114 RepID=UPI00112C735C|nr:adenylate/guanylate cyclase domain-containing protein [Methylomonas koyamae]TPQ26958.1 adenylate/guanylate cyclase domain-containing protein [Methylomonas koyamae]
MPQRLLRLLIVAAIAGLIAGAVSSATDLELSSQDTLFRWRGPLPSPGQVVVVAMDEVSETQLGVGQDLTRWRPYHARLIRQLQQQGARLVIFDLQFITANPAVDPDLAAAMREAGNVLIGECIQKFRHGTADFFGREECAEANRQTVIALEGEAAGELPEQLVAMRKISATPAIGQAALDSAPFFLVNDAEEAKVREVWTFFDALADAPSLPVLAWAYTLQPFADWTGTGQTLSAWLTDRRRDCLADAGHAARSGLGANFDKVLCDGDSRYLNYYGPPKTLRMESYVDVYSGQVNDLRDKVVFVGRANRQFSPGKTDFFPTPFSDSHTGKMAGVEIMATQFANLSQGAFIEMPLPFWSVSAIFGLAIAGLLNSRSKRRGLFASLLLAAAYAGFAVYAFAARHWWLPLAGPVLVQLPVSWLLALVWSRIDLLCERKRLLAFVRQVFPQWATFVPAAPGDWNPDRHLPPTRPERDVSGLCLATDIAGYTGIAAQHSPHEMWQLLNAYYQVLGHPVISHDGAIADVTGDAMMAVWFELAPAKQRLLACLAALEMAEAVAAFNKTSPLAALTTRIGLHEGPLTLGRLETGQTSHYRAIGDTVNTASRIQGVNTPLGTRILATSTITAGIDGVLSRPVGAFRLVGRAEPVELTEIVGHGESIPNIVHSIFADGLAAFRAGHWPEAVRVLQAVLELDANDGPSRFYLKKALAYRQHPPEVWDGVIDLDSK